MACSDWAAEEPVDKDKEFFPQVTRDCEDADREENVRLPDMLILLD